MNAACRVGVGLVAGLLLGCAVSCTLLTSVVEGVFGGSEEPSRGSATARPGEQVLGAPVRDAEGAFAPQLVVEDTGTVTAAEAVPATADRRDDVAPPALDGVEGDQAQKVERAHNPPPARPPEGETAASEWLDLGYELLALLAFAAAFAGFVALARRHAAGLALVLSGLALLAALVW